MKTNHSLWLMPGMMTLLLFPVLAFLFFGCTSRDLERQDPDGAHTLMVSEDGRRIVRSDGAPFFWLGDTAWELFHRLNREEADEYLSDRASKGFNVIQAVVLAELDGLTVPNPYGEIPLIDNDPAKPNEAYFQHVDYVVDKAESLGMFIGMLPTWGDKFNKAWGEVRRFLPSRMPGSTAGFSGKGTGTTPLSGSWAGTGTRQTTKTWRSFERWPKAFRRAMAEPSS